ncbi:MAG: SdrD B-like domain-containing protein [Prochlorotrichaceae cyanobacterium]|jgi:hypothetical protein
MITNTSTSTDYQDSIASVEDEVCTEHTPFIQEESGVGGYCVEETESSAMLEVPSVVNSPLGHQQSPGLAVKTDSVTQPLANTQLDIDKLILEDFATDETQVPSEDSIEGVEVQLKDATETIIATTTTTVDGSYSFTGLEPGLYHLQFTAPMGYAFTFPSFLGDNPALSSESAITELSQSITLASGEFNDTLGAGLILTRILEDTIPLDISAETPQTDIDLDRATVPSIKRSADSVTYLEDEGTAPSLIVEGKQQQSGQGLIQGDYKITLAGLVSYLKALNSLQLT